MPLKLLLGAVGVVFAIVFAGSLLLTRDPREAAARTRQRTVGLLTGAGGMAAAAFAMGVDVVAQFPELLITLLGVGSLLAGISWEVFAAGSLVTWIVAEAVGGPRSA